MSGYRLYFVDENGAIQAREEFEAPDDDLALAASDLVSRACSDTCHSYELWHGGRQVIAFGASRANCPMGLTDEQTVAVQRITLALGESLLQSHWSLARSEKLITEVERLKERSRARLIPADRLPAQNPGSANEPADRAWPSVLRPTRTETA